MACGSRLPEDRPAHQAGAAGQEDPGTGAGAAGRFRGVCRADGGGRRRSIAGATVTSVGVDRTGLCFDLAANRRHQLDDTRTILRSGR